MSILLCTIIIIFALIIILMFLKGAEDCRGDYYDDIIYIDDVEVTIDPMTREEVDHFMEILKNLLCVL